jgi:hypothetical protein
MKHRWIYFLLGGLMTFYACSSNDEPELPKGEPEPTEPTFNKSDSLALVEIYKQGDGANWWVQWDLNNIMTWSGTGWALDTEKNEYRCVKLFMKAKDTGNGTISPKIGELEYLHQFEASGKTFCGEVPASITKLKHLVYIDLTNTLVTKIPDDMFNERLETVYIDNNERLGGTLPSSLTKLRGGQLSTPNRYFSLQNNAFTGAIPVIKDAVVTFSGNNLTSYPMEIAGCFKFGKYNVRAQRNRLSGVIPDEILKDTLRIYHFKTQANWQQEGYGYSNMPTDEEITKMYETYKKNHPEYNPYE